MRKKNFFPYILLIAFVLFLMTLPFAVIIGGRASFLKISTAISRPFVAIKRWFVAAETFFEVEVKENLENSIAKLELEKRLLEETIVKQKELLRQSVSWQNHSFFLQKEPLTSFVVARSPTTWSSSLWIDVGEIENERLGYKHVAKDSPVLVGSSIIGIVDFVGRHQSRVRLITDSGLIPSVRASRGQVQNMLCWQAISFLIRQIELEALVKDEKKEKVLSILTPLKALLEQSDSSLLLAKGELHGTSFPLWRSQASTLKGLGFNYDFNDEAGEARDLRNGAPLDHFSKAAPLAILKVGDILVTTGMDGVFPAGLPVAEVRWVAPLQEGDYSYELEAVPTAGDLESITSVLVLPPLVES